MTGRSPTRPIQSLDRGLALLELVARARRPVSLTELTEHLGIDRSSVFRLANTLKLRGFLAQLPGNKSYLLGSRIWRLSTLFQWGQVLTQIAREHVTSLAAETGETTHLVVQEGRHAIFIDHELTDHLVGVSVCSGRREPLHCTAVGKALIADFDGQRLAELFGDGPLPAATKRTIRSVAVLAEECRRTRKQGFAVDDEEFSRGVRCVAAPIRDSTGEIIAAIGISAPMDRLPKRRFEEVGRQVQRAAQGISVKLGFDGPTKESSE